MLCHNFGSHRIATLIGTFEIRFESFGECAKFWHISRLHNPNFQLLKISFELGSLEYFHIWRLQPSLLLKFDCVVAWSSHCTTHL